MIRPTKEIKLQVSGAKVVLNTYITGGEKRQITEVLTKNFSADTKGNTIGEIPLSALNEANDKAIEFVVVSISDDYKASDLPSVDYELLLEEINKITHNQDFLEDKKS